MKQLTKEELDVLAGLAVAWNTFIELPQLQSDDVTEYRAAIHTAQNIVISRVFGDSGNNLSRGMMTPKVQE